MGKEHITKPQEHLCGRLKGCNFGAAWQIVMHASRPMYPHYGGLIVSVVFITCHSIILQRVTFFPNSCPEYCLNEVRCIYLHFLSVLTKVSKLWKSSFLLMIDLLAFRPRLHLFEFSFKLYCYNLYFVIFCTLEITHFYCMLLSEFPALHNTCTHPIQFVWIIV